MAVVDVCAAVALVVEVEAVEIMGGGFNHAKVFEAEVGVYGAAGLGGGQGDGLAGGERCEVAKAAHRLGGLPPAAGEVGHVMQGDRGGDAYLQAGGGVVEEPLERGGALELMELGAAGVNMEGERAGREIDTTQDNMAYIGHRLPAA